MMMGPTKKKIITTGVIAFIVPVIIGSIFFINYSKKKDEEIAALKVQSKVIERFVFAENMVAGEIITSEDIKGVSVKAESTPIDSFASGDTALEEIIGKRMKINAEAKTIVAKSMFMNEEGEPTIDERYQEFNMILLPSDLEVGDFIDVRLSMPEGEDYLVISGKEVKQIGTSPESNAVFLQLNEEEIIRMTAAILESYMNDGYKLYANKYVDPSNQLYDYERVDYVLAYEEALKEIIEERQAFADTYLEEYLKLYKPEAWELYSGDILAAINDESEDLTSESGETTIEVKPTLETLLALIGVTVVEEDIETLEIAERIGLTEKETEDIRNALKENNDAVLAIYEDKLVVTRRDMINTYPVKANIANVIKSNPNILQTIKDKYNVEKLMEERAALIEFPLYKINDYGELELLEPLQKVQENINQEIETQRAERKEYLQALILEESSAN